MDIYTFRLTAENQESGETRTVDLQAECYSYAVSKAHIVFGDKWFVKGGEVLKAE